VVKEVTQMATITVRWFDGYLETFSNVHEHRIGVNLLWLEFGNNKNRHIPLDQVRWFSVYPTSREPVGVELTSK
jgi:hypothetical protein